MKATGLVLALLLLQASAAAAQSPEIEVVDGKVSMSVSSMPLSRLLGLLDRAMGTKSEVKPELANRNISAQFTGLSFPDAVKKIFQGQPLNYMVIEGKGIRVTDMAQAGAAATTSTTPGSFPSPDRFPDTQFYNNTTSIPPTLAIQPPGPQLNPQQNQGNNANFTMTPFGPQPTPQAANPSSSPSPLNAPGQIPTAIGMGNPFVTTSGGGAAQGGGGNVPFPALPPSAPQPSAPGTLGGATPGTLGK